MAKEYKIWVHVEEYDTETDEHTDLVDNGTMDTIFMGIIKTKPAVDSMAAHFDHFLTRNPELFNL